MPARIPQHLIEQIARRSCIAFAGAGLSMPLGLPSWTQLIALLLDEIGKIEPSTKVPASGQPTSASLFQLAQYAKTELRESSYYDALIRCFSTTTAPHRNHSLLTEIPFAGVITTNYDKLIETSFTLQRGCMPPVFTPLSISALASVLFRTRYFVFKFHGDIDHPESLILTKQDYDRIMFASPHVKAFLQSVFAQNTVVFIGYSLNDPDCEFILSELAYVFSGSLPPHYAILPDPDPVKVDDLKARMNIRVLPYSATGGHGELTVLLTQLRDAVTQTVSP